MIDYKKNLQPTKSSTPSITSITPSKATVGVFSRHRHLDGYIAIRTRLTHSLDVAQMARFIAKSILTKLKREELDTCGYECATTETITERALEK